MHILDRIIFEKKARLKELKASVPQQNLQSLPYFQSKAPSLSLALRETDSIGIIAEFKRKSPSKDWVFEEAKVEEVCLSYEKAEALAISVLTEESFFAGSSHDLQKTRELVQIPLLRKDFIIDEYQILEAKGLGASVVLLIAALLEAKQIKNLAELSQSLGLEVLLEVHDSQELEIFLNSSANTTAVTMIGVNNRDLRTFEVNIERSLELASKIPSNFIKIAESGLSRAEDLHRLKAAGYKGFLIGEAYMKTKNPGAALTNFIKGLQ